MGKIIIILVAQFIATGWLSSQDKRGFAYYDAITYELYLDSSWKELIKTGKEALKEGLDYYYLRMRLGIASFETEDYSRAQEHFTRALEFNSADEVAKEYLYYTLLYYGRDIEAGKIAELSPPGLRQKLSYGTGTSVRSFSLNATTGFIDDEGIIDRFSPPGGLQEDGYQSVTRNYRSMIASLEHEAGNSATIFHSAGYLSKEYLYYSRDGLEDYISENERLRQLQYYISGRVLVGNGLFLVPAIHYINLIIPTEVVIAGRGGRTFVAEQNIYRHDFASSIGLDKYFKRVRVGVTAGFSSINEQKQIQGSFLASWFPLGNLNLYTVSALTSYNVIPVADSQGRWVFSQEAGFRALPGLWIELRGTFGDMANYAGPRAYFIYNDTGVTTGLYGISLIAPFFDRGIELSLHYSYVESESSFVYYQPETYSGNNIIETGHHQLSGGIKWIF